MRVHSFRRLNQRTTIRRLTVGTGFLAACIAATASANPTQARRLLDQGNYEAARDRYQSLAENARLPSREAAFRLGQGLAAYRAGDYRGARAGFSGALLSPRDDVRRNAHLGNGNALFQLGWMGLADSAYPSEPGELPDLDRFDAIARERIARMLDGPEPETGETDGFARIRDTIINWSDAVRHYQSALDLDPSDESAVENRRTTMTYLQRLQELLEEERDETDESMPDSGEGEGEAQPQPGDEPGDEPGDPSEDGRGDEEPEDGSGGDPEEDPENPDSQPGDRESPDEPQPEEPGEEPGDAEPEDPNETPEERARRILSENADVETGPLNPGRREFMPPEKDW